MAYAKNLFDYLRENGKKITRLELASREPDRSIPLTEIRQRDAGYRQIFHSPQNLKEMPTSIKFDELLADHEVLIETDDKYQFFVRGDEVKIFARYKKEVSEEEKTGLIEGVESIGYKVLEFRKVDV